MEVFPNYSPYQDSRVLKGRGHGHIVRKCLPENVLRFTSIVRQFETFINPLRADLQIHRLPTLWNPPSSSAAPIPTAESACL
jgi:hypothetical protein